METVLLFVKEITEKAKRKGGNIHDMFMEYDPKKTGLISFVNFRKLLANINVFVDDEKFEFITTPYADASGFYYELFLNDMQGAKVEKTNKTISEDELRRFGSEFRDQGTDIASILKIYDRQRTGRVEPPVFFRYVTNTPLAQKIAAEYTSEATGEVEYMRLNRDIQAALASKPQSQRFEAQKLPSFMTDVARWFKSQGIDPIGQLMKHDRYKRRKIPTQNFISDISCWGIPLTPQQQDELAAAFSVGDQFDYMAFGEEISRIQATLTRPSSVRKPIIDLNEVLDRITEIIQNRRPTIKDQIESMDINHTGKVPSQRFFRAFTSSGFGLSNGEYEVIDNEFGDEKGNIDYVRFFNQVMPKSAPQVDVDSIYIRLHDFLQENGITLKPRIERFDTGMKGVVPFTQLAAIFRAIGFDINAQETAALKNAIAHNREQTFDYLDFCDLVDPHIEAPKVEKLEPLPRHDRDEDAMASLEAMTRIEAIVTKYQINLSAEFKKYDTKMNGLIRPDSFARVLQSLPIKVLPKEVKILTDFYTSSGGYCSYEQFIQDMTEFGGKRVRQTPEISKTILKDAKPQMQNVEASLHKFKIFLMKDGIPPETVFIPYDANNTGMIPKIRLQPILESIGFPGLPSDYSILAETFTDARLTEKVNYKKLCEAVNRTEIGREEFATTRVDNLADAKLDEGTMAVLVGIREKLLARHKKVRQPFFGINQQLISQRDFRRCIESYGLVIKENDLQKIIRGYKRNMQGDIDWNRFCTDVETANAIH